MNITVLLEDIQGHLYHFSVLNHRFQDFFAASGMKLCIILESTTSIMYAFLSKHCENCFVNQM